MATIPEWLASLGPSEYAQRFAENDIDGTVLPHLTDQDLKEIGVSLGQAYEVVHPGMVESRFEVLSTISTPLIGRDEEIDLLLRRWDQAKRGDGCVVLAAGEPGIGKSRIAETILERLSNEPHARLRNFCSPHHSAAGRPSARRLKSANWNSRLAPSAFEFVAMGSISVRMSG